MHRFDQFKFLLENKNILLGFSAQLLFKKNDHSSKEKKNVVVSLTNIKYDE